MPSREVLFLTPVMRSVQDLSSTHAPRRFSYQLGGQLVPLPATPTQESFAPGFILNMPLDEIESYVRQTLTSVIIQTDDSIVSFLDTKTEGSGRQRAANEDLARIRELVKESALFASLD